MSAVFRKTMDTAFFIVLTMTGLSVGVMVVLFLFTASAARKVYGEEYVDDVCLFFGWTMASCVVFIWASTFAFAWVKTTPHTPMVASTYDKYEETAAGHERMSQVVAARRGVFVAPIIGILVVAYVYFALVVLDTNDPAATANKFGRQLTVFAVVPSMIISFVVSLVHKRMFDLEAEAFRASNEKVVEA